MGSSRPAWLACGCFRLLIAIEPRWTENANDDLTVCGLAENRSSKSVCRPDIPVARCADVGWGIVFGRLVCEPFADLGMVRIVWYETPCL
jgi:hypothetical protein